MWLQSKLLAFAAMGGQRDVSAALCVSASAYLHDGSEMDPDASSAALSAAVNQPPGCNLTIPGALQLHRTAGICNLQGLHQLLSMLALHMIEREGCPPGMGGWAGWP